MRILRPHHNTLLLMKWCVLYDMMEKLLCSSWVFQISMMTRSISIMQTWKKNQSRTTSRWVWASNNVHQKDNTLGILRISSLPKHTHTRSIRSPFNICTPAHELTQSITLLWSVLHLTLFQHLMWYQEVADQDPFWDGILHTAYSH